MLSRVFGLFLGHSFLGWESSVLGSVQRMGGLTREELLPQPQETRMCVLRFVVTLHVPEGEAAAAGPSPPPVVVPGQAHLALVGVAVLGEAGAALWLQWSQYPGPGYWERGGMEQFPLQGEPSPSSLGPCIVNSEGQSDGVQGQVQPPFPRMAAKKTGVKSRDRFRM